MPGKKVGSPLAVKLNTKHKTFYFSITTIFFTKQDKQLGLQKGPFSVKQMQNTFLIFWCLQADCLPAEVYSQHCCLFPPPLQKTSLQSKGCLIKFTQDFRVQIPVKAGGTHGFPRHAVMPTCSSAYLSLLHPVRNLLRGHQAREIYC